MFKVPKSRSSSSPRPSPRLATLVRSRLVSTSHRLSSTRTANTILSALECSTSRLEAHLLTSGYATRSFKNPKSDSSKWLTGKELAEVYAGYTKKYDLVSIEDPFDQVRSAGGAVGRSRTTF